MKKSFKEVDWVLLMNEANNDVDKEAWYSLSTKIKNARDKYIPSKLVDTNRKTKKRFFVLEDSLIHLTRLKRYHYKNIQKVSYLNQLQIVHNCKSKCIKIYKKEKESQRENNSQEHQIKQQRILSVYKI